MLHSRLMYQVLRLLDPVARIQLRQSRTQALTGQLAAPSLSWSRQVQELASAAQEQEQEQAQAQEQEQEQEQAQVLT